MMKVPVISLDATDTDDEDSETKTTCKRNGSVRKVREIQMDCAIGDPSGSPGTTLNTVISRFGRSQSLRRPPTAKTTKKEENGTPGSSRGASPTPSFIDISPIIRTASLRVKNQLAQRLSEPLKKAEHRISKLLMTEPDDEEFQHYSLVHGLKGCNNNDSEDAGSSSDEDDPEYLELLERDSIINRYEKGPDAADVDAWENPDFEVYTNLDRFGFVHKKGEKTDERTDLQKRRIIKELSREKKWLKMIEIWKSGGPSKKMEDRIWKGIPEKLRIVIWPRLLGAERMKHERRDMYAELLLRARLVSKDIKQIDLDINRTYRDHLAFRKRYDVKQKSLLNVLAAYSMYNTEVGYCQGMSQIAALFLMYLDEEDAFWCLHQLMVSPKHTMHGFFVPGFPKLQRFEEHFKKILKKYKPRVFKYLEKQDIPYIYLTKWWFGCFLDRVPFSLALRLWDVFLVEGDSILLAMAYNIMKMHEKSIRKHSMESFMEFIQNEIAQDFGYSDDEVMYSLRETLSKLKSDRQHVPPPPRPEDLSEVPTKALGPILQKPMASIREEIHEIQSRRSRANSTGRSPHPKRKESGRGPSKGPPPVQHKWNGNASQDSILGNGREVPFEKTLKVKNGGRESSEFSEDVEIRNFRNICTMGIKTTGNSWEIHLTSSFLQIPTRRVPNTSSPALSADAYMSPPPHGSNGSALPPTGSSKRDTTPTTSTTHRYHNSHQNPSRGGTPSTQRLRDERNGQMVLLSRASDSEPDVTSPVEGNRREDSWKDASTMHISTATSRITHSGNNITRIELDGDVSVI
ncbi:Protein CBG07920 [Caenorhabditis briggsae]|uniref:Protein CBG07920 n=1 Tax=Caenorhabditis briggsae TaxID=6238 RepID=A8X569_CAEBR|nr:Protein CBG07920 [Caenorhabditis briggsae]CAP27844.1 Protein CBG07920 [Caenorhabditis briggsae]